MLPTIDTVAIAINLARNAGYAVFPCKADKSPACPHGFKDATKTATTIMQLWHDHPGPLIGVATGLASSIWVVDIDAPKHRPAYDWWQANHPRLSHTRVFATRSGGLHLYFTHGEGIGNTAGRICKGIDTRGDGGYVIYWFAQGLQCFSPGPPIPFPAWLRRLLDPPPVPAQAYRPPGGDPDTAIAGILRKLADAQKGDRNNLLHWAAHRLLERGMTAAAIEAELLPIARQIGLPDAEARRTIASATTGGV